ncbi:MAG TPA: bifunctional cobalt-precorrin-7 (C(5))-methyltransferase/cobalt-precorrin-6B (C(15))-methyltransferase, partial [Lachnospiraceae bacterium]|nr:bifunctional cobalt-precorrin-7 (C(5))-methyltransferase/cobalt-precorrin-6B (C(15))-methyltransferase [Lachnospiraceae bacterium]
MIGGSGGMIREVLECVLEKNPRVRIAATAATLETLQEILKAAELLDLEADYTQI